MKLTQPGRNKLLLRVTCDYVFVCVCQEADGSRSKGIMQRGFLLAVNTRPHLRIDYIYIPFKNNLKYEHADFRFKIDDKALTLK